MKKKLFTIKIKFTNHHKLKVIVVMYCIIIILSEIKLKYMKKLQIPFSNETKLFTLNLGRKILKPLRNNLWYTFAINKHVPNSFVHTGIILL